MKMAIKKIGTAIVFVLDLWALIMVCGGFYILCGLAFLGVFD